jgi:hypothetical protein
VTVSDLPSPANEGAAPESHAPPDGTIQLFINVGRREGVRVQDLEKFLSEHGVPVEDLSGIRIRDRMTFILVRKEHFDRAIAALSGQTIGGRTVVAELARGANRA